jgi:NAD-dependent SIR2 family protein deacetylase
MDEGFWALYARYLPEKPTQEDVNGAMARAALAHLLATTALQSGTTMNIDGFEFSLGVQDGRLILERMLPESPPSKDR